MTIADLLRAAPESLWTVCLTAALGLPTLARLLVRRKTKASVAQRIAARVAVQSSIGFAAVVAIGGFATLRSGLAAAALPDPQRLMQAADDVQRLRVQYADDSQVLSARLKLLSMEIPGTTWSLLVAPGCTRRAACLIAADLSAVAVDEEKLRSTVMVRVTEQQARHIESQKDPASSWPLRLGNRISMVTAIPLRFNDGRIAGTLFVGRDVTASGRDATFVSSSLLLASGIIWWMLVVGMGRTAQALVSDRIRSITHVLADADRTRSVMAEPDDSASSDDLAQLAVTVTTAAHLLQRRDAQFEAIFEHLPIGIAQIDAQAVIRRANAPLRLILSTPTDPHTIVWDDLFVHEAQLLQFRTCVKGGVPLLGARWEWRDLGGHQRLVRVSIVPLPGDGEASMRVMLIEDETAHVHLERKLANAQRLELIGRVAGGIAHDFNNLLTIIRGSVSTLQDIAPSDELEAIDAAADRGARLVRRLLTVSRQDIVAPEAQSVRRLVTEVLEMFRRVVPATVSVRTPAAIPEYLVKVDTDAVEHALLNLLLNARDAIPANGTIVVSVEPGPLPGTGQPGIAISIRDNGRGMSADVLARVTEPFFSTKGSEKGSGLGLSVVQAVMERHGGRFELQSEPGAGTRVTLWFPREASTTALSTVASAKDTERRLSVTNQTRVLLVEDEASVRRATTRVLESSGFQVVATESMAQALAALKAEPPFAIVVTDIIMPGGSGIDLYRVIRSFDKDMPVLFVSGFTFESLDDILDSDPRTGALSKPWTPQALRERIGRLFR